MKVTIDETIERLIFLLNAREENFGLYELTWEFGQHLGMEIGEKYSLAKRIVMHLIENKFASIVLYHEDGQETVLDAAEMSRYLDNPANWYPTTSPMPKLIISDSGTSFLNKGFADRKQEINGRMFGKSDT
jgi:hypothetical protein